MMPNFNVVSTKQGKTISSLEVAEMLGKEHKYIIREIEGSKDGKTVGIIPVLLRANFALSDYFIESTYKDGSGKSNKCYEVTKMGCEMLGNKQQGEKGILFTAKYVKRFNDMEQVLKEQPRRLTPQEELRLHYQVLEEHTKEIESVREEVTEVREEVIDLKDNMPLFNIECKELQALVRSKGVQVLGGYKSTAYNDHSLRGKVYSDIQRQLKREFGISKYEAIKRSQLDIARSIVEEYKAPTVLVAEISNLNNQMRLA